MKTLVVTHYFPPEIGAPQARLSEMARYWAEAGDDVTVLTGMPNHPTGVIPPEYQGKVLLEEHTDGYRVVRTWLYATANEGIVKKTLGHLSFMLTSLFLGVWKVSKPDVVVVSSPTFFSIFSAYAIARIKRARFVVEVRDLWPAIFVELGVLTNRRIVQLLERLELWAYRVADEVVVVTQGFKDDLVRRGVPEEKVHVIRNGVDLDRFTPDRDPTPGRQKLGVADNHCVVLYLGAHGISHGLDAVVRAAKLLEDEPVDFVFVGEGAKKADLKRQAAEENVRNVRFFPGVARDEVPSLVAAADICLVPLRNVPLFGMFIPSKIFEYLGAGKAVVGAVRGEPAVILDEAGASVVPPEDAQALAAEIRRLAGDPDLRRARGEAGHEHVRRRFDRRKLSMTYRALLSPSEDPDDRTASSNPASWKAPNTLDSKGVVRDGSRGVPGGVRDR